jgi:hypothetical protein
MAEAEAGAAATEAGAAAAEGPDLMVLASELASNLAGVSTESDGGRVSYRRGDTVFARVSADALEVRLPEDIADAAERTPDTVLIPGQLGWIRFAPRGSERHVTDRATAWFETAWRHADDRDATTNGSA